MKIALGLSAAALLGGVIGLGIAYAFERLIGDPWYR